MSDIQKSNPNKRRLAILGAGGHARETAMIAERVGIERTSLAFVVEQRYVRKTQMNGIAVCALESGICDDWPFVAAIGEPTIRESLVTLALARGMTPQTLCDSQVHIHETIEMAAGCVVAFGAMVTVNTRLGSHVHLNIGCSVSHDCDIGEFSTISPGARIAGHVRVGRRVFVGVGATIINGTPDKPLVIGDDVFIAAGACVVTNVPEGTRVAGVPAKAF